jgi:hypothetical protein
MMTWSRSGADVPTSTGPSRWGSSTEVDENLSPRQNKAERHRDKIANQGAQKHLQRGDEGGGSPHPAQLIKGELKPERKEEESHSNFSEHLDVMNIFDRNPAGVGAYYHPR